MGAHEPDRESTRPSVRIPWLRLVAEFAVIFLGVTLGLLADDWRQSRIDRADERMALEELLADLETDSIKMDSLRLRSGIYGDAALWIHQRLGDSDIDQDRLASALGSIYDWYTYPAPRATYAGLRSTGRLTLVRDDDLRREITRYYEERQPYISGFFEANGELWLDVRDAIALDVEWRRPEGVGGFLGGRVMELRRPWSQVPTDPLLGHRIELFGILSEVIETRASEVLTDNSELRQSIRTMLGN